MIKNWKHFLIPYDQAVEELKMKFKSIRDEYRRLDEYSPIEFVIGRTKRISSIINKAKKREIALEEIENRIEDIAGIRIMCQFVEDIEKVVKLIKERNGKDLTIMDERDYIKNNKESGYRSYHIIIGYVVHTAFGEKKIFAEIQIRTLAMNFWATIEHSLNYKFKYNIPEDIKLRLKKASEAASQLDDEMSQIRSEVVEAQELFQAKSSLTEEILRKMQDLYFIGRKEEIDDIRQKFYTFQEKGDVEKLKELNRKLDESMAIYEMKYQS